MILNNVKIGGLVLVGLLSMESFTQATANPDEWKTRESRVPQSDHLKEICLSHVDIKIEVNNQVNSSVNISEDVAKLVRKDIEEFALEGCSETSFFWTQQQCVNYLEERANEVDPNPRTDFGHTSDLTFEEARRKSLGISLADYMCRPEVGLEAIGKLQDEDKAKFLRGVLPNKVASIDQVKVGSFQLTGERVNDLIISRPVDIGGKTVVQVSIPSEASVEQYENVRDSLRYFFAHVFNQHIDPSTKTRQKEFRKKVIWY